MLDYSKGFLAGRQIKGCYYLAGFKKAYARKTLDPFVG